jgi:membrane-bound lytic murein transglycosylase D
MLIHRVHVPEALTRGLSSGDTANGCALMISRMATIFFALGCLLIFGVSTCRGGRTVDAEDVLGGFDESALTNLDLSAWPALTDINRTQLQSMCRQLQKQLQGEYVLELAPLREVASAALPLLEEYPETQPYAAWLRSRLDYLAVADELKVAIPAPSLELKPAGSVPMNPGPEAERQAWRQHLKTEDLPPGAGVYVTRLKPIFVAEGVPAELVWLAEVESRFDTGARSPIGAAGLFQLMPETAKSLGLTLTPSDQRLQPEKNARAAARYLRHLYETFGDWRLAVAAYNGGEGLVGRLLEKRGAHNFDEIAAELPAETQMYVPKVEATILRREGLALENLKLPMPVTAR